MITKFKVFSGIFSVNVNNKKMIFKLSYDIDKKPFEINLINNDEIYDNLSVVIPDSKDLDSNEFYLNTDIDNNIVNELIKQGFIIKTDKQNIAGDKKTNSYKLNI